VKGPWYADYVFGPFESAEQARAYIHSERFANFDFDPDDCWLERFSGTNPIHVVCTMTEWTRPNMPQFRDPDTGLLVSSPI
jgi:hypothetical protein